MKSEWWLMVVWVWVADRVLKSLSRSIHLRQEANKG